MKILGDISSDIPEYKRRDIMSQPTTNEDFRWVEDVLGKI